MMMLVQVWNQTFRGELGPLPAIIKAPCCAEFMVSRDRIRAHSRWDMNTEQGLTCRHVRELQQIKQLLFAMLGTSR